ncbi:MAG: aminopeptidase [Lachnospiraceae bacterium]|nr:aminopeptidase [Lachnospiraceae bacterium]
MENKNTWESYSAAQIRDTDRFSGEYMDFLNKGKTERECTDYFVDMAEKAGYTELSVAVEKGMKLKPGSKLYAVNMSKAVILFNIGKKPLSQGMNILGAHIDSPRLDIKQIPVYEDGGFALLDTHYYGGIKKYQWVTIPLAIHGVVVKKDGTIIELNIGEDEDDPVFFVSDILIHMAQEQMEKKASKAVEGEALDIIAANRPLIVKGGKKKSEEGSSEKDKVKAMLLDVLRKEYGIEEEDFISAELEVVPAGKAREAGFDRSMILAYGHDDKVCAYTSMRAMLDVKTPDRTSCCILVDKEEIGSVGATGMQSRFFENCVAEILNMTNKNYSELDLKRCLQKSAMLSSDVTSAFDPLYASCYDKKNAAFFGCGPAFSKFTGSRGKSGSNDANAEYIAHIRDIFDKDKVNFQTSELGKVDIGGGGTIAYILALYGMNVIDVGVPVLNMHAPWECVSKADVFETYRCYIAFLNRCTI